MKRYKFIFLVLISTLYVCFDSHVIHKREQARLPITREYRKVCVSEKTVIVFVLFFSNKVNIPANCVNMYYFNLKVI